MSVNKGNIKISANYDVQLQAPIDGRLYRPTKSHLINKESWSYDGNTIYVHEGMQTYVADEKRTYILTHPEKIFDEDFSGWEILGGNLEELLVIDEELNETSTNSVQNRVITNALNAQAEDFAADLVALDTKLEPIQLFWDSSVITGQDAIGLTDEERAANITALTKLQDNNYHTIYIRTNNTIIETNTYGIIANETYVTLPEYAGYPGLLLTFDIDTGDVINENLSSRPLLIMDINSPEKVIKTFQKLMSFNNENDIQGVIPFMVYDGNMGLSLCYEYVYSTTEANIKYNIDNETFLVIFNSQGEITSYEIINGGYLTLDVELDEEAKEKNALLYNNIKLNNAFKCLCETNSVTPITVKANFIEDELKAYSIIVLFNKKLHTWLLNPDGTTDLLSSESLGSGGTGGGDITLDVMMSDFSENAVQNKVIKKYVDDSVKDVNEALKPLTQRVNLAHKKIEANEESIDTLNETVSEHTTILETLTNGTEGSIGSLINDAKETIDSYTVNNKKISESPVLDTNDIKVSNDFSLLDRTEEHVYPGDIITDALSKLEIMLANTTLALTAAINDLEYRIGIPSEYDSDGFIIKEGYGLHRVCEQLQEQINRIK